MSDNSVSDSFRAAHKIQAYAKIAIQIAKISGFSPIITTASLRNADMLKGIGATHVLDRNLPTSALSEEIMKITSKPLQIVYDAISLPATQNAAFDVLAPGGHLVLVLPDAIDAAKKAAEPSKKIVVLAGTEEIYAEDNSVWSKLTELVEEGLIKVCGVSLITLILC